MPKKIHITVGSSVSRVEDKLPADVVKEVNKLTSYKNPDQWNRRYWDSRVYLFRRSSQTFPTGLLKRVKKAIKSMDYKVAVNDTRKQFKPIEDKILGQLNDFTAILRDYQVDGIMRGVFRPYGLYWWPTGSGKTVLFSALMQSLNMPTLVLTHRKELLYQLSENITHFTGEEVGVIGDGVFDPKRWTVGIVNSLMSRNDIKDAKVKKYLAKVRYLIIDECHHLGANSWWKIAMNCTNTKARHGFSGTCFRTDNADLLLLAHTGDVISKYSTTYMIENGWLARPNIHLPTITAKTRGRLWDSVEKELIRDNYQRNNIGCEFVAERYNKDEQVLVMVKLIEHGNLIQKMLSEDYDIDPRDIRFMNGMRLGTERQQAVQDFRDGKYQILIGSSIYNEGVDIPTINAAINFAGGDSEIATTQRLGRAIRKFRRSGEIDVDPDVEQSIEYMDFNDTGHRFVRKHSRTRTDFYKSEKAFRVYEK